MVTRVNLKDEKYEVYISRPRSAERGSGFFGYPFVIGLDGDRANVIQKYREMLRRKPELVARIRAELKG
jgi:hypothetical protein